MTVSIVACRCFSHWREWCRFSLINTKPVFLPYDPVNNNYILKSDPHWQIMDHSSRYRAQKNDLLYVWKRKWISYASHACEGNRDINASCFDGSLKIILMQTLSFECGQVWAWPLLSCLIHKSSPLHINTLTAFVNRLPDSHFTVLHVTVSLANLS